MLSPRFDSVDQDDATPCIDFLSAAHDLPQVRAIKQRSRDLLRLTDGDKALEAGCGLGLDACALATQVGATGRVMGVDSSRAMIAAARRTAAGAYPNVLFRQADVHRLPFVDEQFDGSRADRLLHLLEHPARALAEIVRVTRVGACVVIGEPDWGSLDIRGGDEAITSAILAHARSVAPLPRRVGAHLTALFSNVGLEVEVVIPEPMVITDFLMGVRLFSLGGLAYHAVCSARVSADAARHWFESLARAAAQGEFQCSLMGYTVAGTRQPHACTVAGRTGVAATGCPSPLTTSPQCV